MDIPFDKICNYFKCYDTNVNQVHLNLETKQFLAKLGLYSDVIDVWGFLKMVPFISFIHLVCIGQVGHMVHYLQNNDFVFFEVADDISVILTIETISLVLIYLAKNAPNLNAISKKLGDFQDPDLGRARGVEAMDKLFTKYVNASKVIFIALALVAFVFYVTNSCEENEISACGFIFLPYLPYIDIYNSPWRQIWLLCQCMSSYSGGAIILIYISQYMYINEIVILRYDHLQSLMRRIPKTKNHMRPALIGRIVRYHNYLIGLNNQTNSNVGNAYALHLCITPINMSVIAYQLLEKEFILSSVIHFLTYVIIVILTCGSGERLSTYTQELYFTIYKSMPLDDLKTVKDMNLILLHSEKPLQALAGGFTAVNHILMGDVFKAVWSTLTVLIQTGE